MNTYNNQTVFNQTTKHNQTSSNQTSIIKQIRECTNTFNMYGKPADSRHYLIKQPNNQASSNKHKVKQANDQIIKK